MKLLYITNGINGSGGLERVLAIKASYLSDQLGYEVHILTLNESDHKPFYIFSSKVHFHSISVKGNSLRYSINYSKGIKRIIRQLQPHVISVCDDGLKAFFLPLILGNKIPLIYERHASIQLNFSNQEATKKQQLMHYMMQKLGRKFDAFIVLTNGNLKEWKGNNLKVIPNPLSFYPTNSSSLQKKRVIAVGSHSNTKGYDLLLKAWKKVIKIHPDWSLHICGKQDQEKKYIKLATNLGLDKCVVFSPPIPYIEKVYLESTIMVLSSRSEGFGMVLIEAMACGLPCVAFDCPHGPADIITHGEDGFLIENGNIDQMANAIMQLIEYKSVRIDMGTTAKKNVKRYLKEHVMPLWDDLFKKLENANRL